MKKQSYQDRKKQLKIRIALCAFSLFFMILSFVLDDKPFWNHPLPLITTFLLWLNVSIYAKNLRRDFKHKTPPHNFDLLPK